MRTWLVLATLGAVLATGVTANAQSGPGYYANPPPPPMAQRGVMRSGIIAGGGIGIGAISFTDCEKCDSLGGLALNVFIGGMLAPNLALFLDLATVMHVLDNEESTLLSNTVTGVLRGWVSSILWLEGGIGSGQMQLSDSYGLIAETKWGFGLIAGAGIEVMQAPHFTIDIQLRISAARYDYGDGVGVSNAVLSAGFNWY